MTVWEKHALVRSAQFGVGRVQYDEGATVVVRFEHGLEECESDGLERIRSPGAVSRQPEWEPPLEVITRIQAELIRSVNDAWGVFARSRIALLPHQLWVCRQVIERWPARWLVADDVGLGKTVEAGLILWPLLARGAVRRLLVVTPASLVEQWQRRLLELFDIRLPVYNGDSSSSKFWDVNDKVIASIQTLRADHKGRHDRFFAAEPWDLVVVDEAHHLSYDDKFGSTLA